MFRHAWKHALAGCLSTALVAGFVPGISVPDVPGLLVLIALLAPLTGSLPLGTARGAIDVPIVCDFAAP